MAVAKVYVGGSWVEAKWKDYDGSDWVERGKVWDGSAWVDIGGAVPVQFDSASSGAVSSGAPSWTHTTVAECTMLVHGFMFSNGTPTVSGTAGGGALTQIALVNTGVHSGYDLWLFAFARPGIGPGPNSVALTSSGAIQCTASSLAYTGVGVVDAPLVKNVSSSTAHTRSVTVPDGGMAAALGYLGMSASGFNQTARTSRSAIVPQGDCATPGAQNFTWTLASAANGAIIATVLNPA